MTQDQADPSVERLVPPVGEADLGALADVLVDAVASGAAVSFLTLSRDFALEWWRKVLSAPSPAPIVLVAREDDKLTQKEWNRFVEEIIDILPEYGTILFFGGSSTFAPWQNVAWLVEVDNHRKSLDRRLEEIRKRYKQDSVFFMVGDGQFI